MRKAEYILFFTVHIRNTLLSGSQLFISLIKERKTGDTPLYGLYERSQKVIDFQPLWLLTLTTHMTYN